MSAEWKGNLRNSGPDIFIDTLGVLLTICSYMPQIARVRISDSTRGISPYYVALGAIFSNAQLSDNLLTAAYAWPTAKRPVLDAIHEGSLTGIRAFGGILGLLQVFVQWLCAVLVLVVFVSAYSRSEGGAKGRTLLIVVSLHAAAVVLPAMLLSLPSPDHNRNFSKGVATALVSMSNQIIAPCSIVLQFIAQFNEMRDQHGDPGALSLLSLGLQVVAMAFLGVRWFLRIGGPTWGNLPAPMRLWYEWAFTPTNFVLCAIGCMALIACYAFAGRTAATESWLDDRTPLLS